MPQTMQPSPKQRRCLHFLRKNTTRSAHESVHPQALGPITNGLSIHLVKPLARLDLLIAITGAKQRRRLGMGEVQAPLAGQQKFTSNRRHGVEQMNRNARLRQHLCGHQPGGATAHNGHLGLENRKIGRSGGSSSRGSHEFMCWQRLRDRRALWDSVKIAATLAASSMFTRKRPWPAI